jgi:hypothetical protein
MMPEISGVQAFSFGALHAIGRFDPACLAGEDRIDTASERVWFALGETSMAALIALVFAVPAGFCVAAKAGITGALVAAGLLFLLLFVFVPKLVRYGAAADTGAVILAFGKNEQIKKVFWTVFLALAGLVFAQVAEPGAVEQVLAVLAGI